MLAKVFLNLALASLGAALVLESSFAPWGWNITNPKPDEDRTLPIIIVLRQADPDGFMPTVLEGGRLTREEIAAYRQPSNETVALVTDWLNENDIEFHHGGDDLVRFNTTVKESQELLKMTLAEYAHGGWNDTQLRTTNYSIPDTLQNHIDFIHPICNFIAPKRSPLTETENAWIWDRVKWMGVASSEPVPQRQGLRKEQLRKDYFKEMRDYEEKMDSVVVEDDPYSPYWEKTGPATNDTTREQREKAAATIEEEGKRLHRPGLYNNIQCHWVALPDCIRGQYEMPALSHGIGAPANVRLGLAGAMNTAINREDVKIFAYKYVREAPIEDQYTKMKTEIFKGDKHYPPPKLGGAQDMIDVQYSYGLAHPHEVTHYTTSTTRKESNDNEAFLDLLDYLLNKPDDEIPHVLAVPYAEAEQIVPRAYAERICRYFGLLTARGVTIVASSGDGGASGATTIDTCVDFGPNLIMSAFPATCPWVTAVGGVNTRMFPTPSLMSGGGFSDYFPRPFWQNSLVTEYQSQLDDIVIQERPFKTPPTQHYQNNMRGVPDVALIGKRFQPVYGGIVCDWPEHVHHAWFANQKGLISMNGATVIFAAMAVHENDRRLKLGQPTLGWLNRRLYEDVPRDMFIDINRGNTYTCSRTDKHHFWGWIATPGWDAASGLGTPRGMSMFNHVQ